MLSYIAAVAITVNPWLQAPVTRCVSATELREFARAAPTKRVWEA